MTSSASTVPASSVPVAANQHLNVRDIGSGPVVLLLHGIPGSAASWRAVAEDLADDHRVLVPDLLGFGASSRPTDAGRLHAAGQSAALGQALDHLGVDHAIVVGHDFGGPISLLLHKARPTRVSGLLLASTNGFTDTPIPFPLVTVTWPIVGQLMARLLFSRPALRQVARRAVGDKTTKLDLESSVGDRAQASAIRTIFSHSLRRLGELYRPVEDELARVTAPTTVLWGEHDPFFPVAEGERLAARVRGAELRVLDGAGHFLPEERPIDVASAIRSLVHSTEQPTTERSR